MKYIVAVGKTREEIDAYLGFSSQVVKSASCKRGTVAMISVDDQDAQWQSGRFASGMMGGRAYDLDGAEDDYGWWVSTNKAV